MTRFLSLAGRRLLVAIPTLFIVLAGIFILLQFADGDTVDALVAQMGGSDPTMIAELRKHYELDQSASTRLLNYMWHLLQLDLGVSAVYGKPVLTVILERLPVTLLLMGSALAISFALGMALGIIASRRVNRWPDSLISTLGLIFYATPSFWL